MPDPARLRDSTQIVLPCAALDDVREQLEAEFTVTIYSDDGDVCRIIASPVEIKAVAEFLTRHGVSVR
ncbi:hypothetical protein [Halobaculum sp. MBLA0143]|uniref:VNG_1110C family protein n=1 Tax=Halobaculum sp. MBLA0143 TaxID=3079933 RepID=UPI0035243120